MAQVVFAVGRVFDIRPFEFAAAAAVGMRLVYTEDNEQTGKRMTLE
jgi:hypothetical protein